MSDSLDILLTNDDGIDSPGIRALYETLTEFANVTVVAPATDQSAVGRSMSSEQVDVVEHELGYAVDGTPADCVVAGLGGLDPAPDLVVSGCNKGANLGEYVLGRSGTVSAAVEAAFFDVPAIATSLYVPIEDQPFHEIQTTKRDYLEAARVCSFLVDHAFESGVFERAAYLNVNTPLPADEPAPIEVTRPSKRYEMDAEWNSDAVVLEDCVWSEMNPETIPDPEGTDRRAVVEGKTSITPLRSPHGIDPVDGFSTVLRDYPDVAPELSL